MEVNIYTKNPLRAKYRIAYVYPSTYRSMISGLSMDIIYHMLNRDPDIYVERFVCSKLYGDEIDPRSLETNSRLRDFPLILTTLHYEPDIVNLVRLLVGGGTEIFSKLRKRTVIVAGGPAVMENPIPYSDIIDVFVIGEAEATLPRLIDLWMEYGDVKKRFLEEADRLDYVFVPSIGVKRVKRSYQVNLDSAFYPIRQIEHTEIEPVYGRGFKLEVARGCKFYCSFCIETRVFQPYRERSLVVMRRLIESGLEYTMSGKRVLLYSLSFPVSETHLGLLEYLVSNEFRATLPSVRISNYLLRSLDLIKQLGQRSLSIAPESFSTIIQRFICKYTGLIDYVIESIDEILKKGFDVKMYLIYGFKGTDIEVVKTDVEYLKLIWKLAKGYGRKVSISLNPLIPKPHTMFQWIGMLQKETLENTLSLYRGELRGIIESRPYDVDWGIIQAQIALSGKPLGDFILRWALRGGGLAGWRRAMKESNIDYSYVYSGYSVNEQLPWGFIDHGDYIEKINLSQYECYLRAKST